MTETTDLEILFPDGKTVEVEVDGEKKKMHIPQFKLGKTLRMLATVAELTDAVDLASLVKQAQKGEQSFTATLLERVPEMVISGQPIIPRMVAQALMPNEEYKRIDIEGQDFNQSLKPYLSIALDMDVDKTMEVIELAIDGMGLEQLKNAAQKFLKKIGNVT
jgi:hypothetical protein